jgi:hypothetical protein
MGAQFRNGMAESNDEPLEGGKKRSDYADDHL